MRIPTCIRGLVLTYSCAAHAVLFEASRGQVAAGESSGVPSSVSTSWTNDAVSRDSAALGRLLEEVRQILRAGWRAEATPNVTQEMRVPWRTGDTPCLVVWREAKAAAEIVAPGMIGQPDYRLQRMRYQLTLTEFYSPAEFDQAALLNAARERRRAEFVAAIPGMPASGSYKGYFPPRPVELVQLLGSLSPEQAELVRQYALLWSRTEPVLLPTHIFETLSLVMERENYGFQDAAIERECEGVWESIQALVSAYPADANSADGGR